MPGGVAGRTLSNMTDTKNISPLPTVADVDEVRFLVADSCLVMEMSLSDETRRLNGRLYRSARIVFAASGEGFDGVVTTGPSPGTPLRWTGTLVRP